MEVKDSLIEKPMEFVENLGPFCRTISKRGATANWKLREAYKGYITEEAIYYYFIQTPKFKRMPKSIQNWIHECDGVWLMGKDLRKTKWTRKIK
jgi:hypothetical protein